MFFSLIQQIIIIMVSASLIFYLLSISELFKDLKLLHNFSPISFILQGLKTKTMISFEHTMTCIIWTLTNLFINIECKVLPLQ